MKLADPLGVILMIKQRGKRILVVDDNIHIVEMLAEFLESTNYTAFRAINAQQALTVLNPELVDLAMVDIRMPGMDGIELTRILKKRKPSLPIILHSAEQAVEATDALKAGASAYIRKPFVLAALEQTIERLLKKQDDPTN